MTETSKISIGLQVTKKEMNLKKEREIVGNNNL